MIKYEQVQLGGYVRVIEGSVEMNGKARCLVSESETRIPQFSERKRQRYRKRSIFNSIFFMTVVSFLSSTQVVAKSKQVNKRRQTSSPSHSPRISSSIATMIDKEASGIILTTIAPTQTPPSTRAFMIAGGGKNAISTPSPTPNNPEKNEDNLLTVSEKLDIALHRTSKPSLQDSSAPTLFPSSFPSVLPTLHPTILSSLQPSIHSSSIPSYSSSMTPSITETFQPSLIQSDIPTIFPSYNPTNVLSEQPIHSPSDRPTYLRSVPPSVASSNNPTSVQSNSPTSAISNSPTSAISNLPSIAPSILPTILNSVEPTISPSFLHSTSPSQIHSNVPSLTTTTINPTFDPTNSPIMQSSKVPTSTPTTISFISSLSNLWNESSALYTGSPTSAPTHVPFISSITCQMATDNKDNVKQQIYYTYSIETQDDSINANITNDVMNAKTANPKEDMDILLRKQKEQHQYVISFIEQSLLYNLAKHFLPCTLNNSKNSRNMILGSNMDHDRHLQSFVSREMDNIHMTDQNMGRKMEETELPQNNFKKENNVVLTSINSDPPDHISTNSKFFVFIMKFI